MHSVHYGEHPDGVQLRYLCDPTVSGGGGGGGGGEGGVGGVGESTLIDEDSLFAQLSAFYWARGIEKSDAELAKVISTVKEVPSPRPT